MKESIKERIAWNATTVKVFDRDTEIKSSNISGDAALNVCPGECNGRFLKNVQVFPRNF
jgi:hypothetical protein